MLRSTLFSGVQNGKYVGGRNQEFNTKRGSQKESQIEMHEEGGNTFSVRFKGCLSATVTLSK